MLPLCDLLPKGLPTHTCFFLQPFTCFPLLNPAHRCPNPPTHPDLQSSQQEDQISLLLDVLRDTEGEPASWSSGLGAVEAGSMEGKGAQGRAVAAASELPTSGFHN